MFESLEQTLVHVNIAAQKIPGLAGAMRAASFLGVETFYFALVPALFWLFSRRAALELLLMIIATAYTNSILKWVFSRPRPYWISDSVQALAEETTYGIPSGHAQNAVVVWFMLAVFAVRKWPNRKTAIYGVATFIVALISFARIYLGVHFIEDIVAGWLFGSILLALYFKFHKPMEEWWRVSPARVGVVLLPVVLLWFAFKVRTLSPGSFSDRGPLSLATVISTQGSLLGLIIVFLIPVVSFQPHLRMRIVLLVVTLAIVLGLQVGLTKLFAPYTHMEMEFRFIRYFLVCIVGFLLIPWSAKKLLS
jgi:membrane-associated phospholipid phosphatase